MSVLLVVLKITFYTSKDAIASEVTVFDRNQKLASWSSHF